MLGAGVARPRLLDLYCGAGGCSVGYHRAGFEVQGVDLHPQPNYPFPFQQGDVLDLEPEYLAEFAAIHASPPCQAHTDMTHMNVKVWGRERAPDLVPATRALLKASGRPYVIENVQGCPMPSYTILCGSMFPEQGLAVKRHRKFETNWLLLSPGCGEHKRVHVWDPRQPGYGETDQWEDWVSVFGDSSKCSTKRAKQAMGVDWMQARREVTEAIPPAYTEFVGEQLLRVVACW